MTNDGDNLSVNAHVVQSGPVFFTAINWHERHVAVLPLCIQVQPHFLAVGVHPNGGVQALRRQYRQHCTHLHNYHNNSNNDKRREVTTSPLRFRFTFNFVFYPRDLYTWGYL